MSPICYYIVFQFGDSQKLRLVRILRSTVMVRVGGGWVGLEEFLQKNDPCRGKFFPMFFFRLREYYPTCKQRAMYYSSSSGLFFSIEWSQLLMVFPIRGRLNPAWIDLKNRSWVSTRRWWGLLRGSLFTNVLF